MFILFKKVFPGSLRKEISYRVVVFHSAQSATRKISCLYAFDVVLEFAETFSELKTLDFS